MAREAGLNPILQGLFDSGILTVNEGVPYLTVSVKNAKDETETQLLQFTDLIGVTTYALNKFVDSLDKTATVKREYRRQSEKMLRDGFMPDSVFDGLYGEGEAANVRAKAVTTKTVKPDESAKKDDAKA